jgi:hypothetical protein
MENTDSSAPDPVPQGNGLNHARYKFLFLGVGIALVLGGLLMWLNDAAKTEAKMNAALRNAHVMHCLLYTSPSPRDH